jgi:hypothetical protein
MGIHTILCFVLIIALSACSSDNSANEVSTMYYDLDWKLAEGEILAYRTAIIPVNLNEDSASTEEAEATPDFGILIRAMQPSSYSMVSLLQLNERGNIEVQMIVNDVDLSEATEVLSPEALETLSVSFSGVQLRGELNLDGGIESFYLEQRQKNLLAMFFELPTHPVSVGDSWEIEVYCVTMGNGFIVDIAERTNQVTFTELTTNSEGKALAVIDYFILESVSGDFINPMSDEAMETSMDCSFIGRGYFLIDEGRWESFFGNFNIISTNPVMNLENRQQFSLVPFDYEVPQEEGE